MLKVLLLALISVSLNAEDIAKCQYTFGNDNKEFTIIRDDRNMEVCTSPINWKEGDSRFSIVGTIQVEFVGGPLRGAVSRYQIFERNEHNRKSIGFGIGGMPIDSIWVSSEMSGEFIFQILKTAVSMHVQARK